MRMTGVSFLVVLVCSCHQSGHGLRFVQQRNELSGALETYWGQNDPQVTTERYRWRFRGPLTTPDLVERDLIADGHGKAALYCQEWARLKKQYREGDEFYFYFKATIGEVHFSEGYALIRNRKVVDWFPTLGN